MATIKVFSPAGIKELSCFDTADNVDYITMEEDQTITDDGELTVGSPISE